MNHQIIVINLRSIVDLTIIFLNHLNHLRYFQDLHQKQVLK